VERCLHALANALPDGLGRDERERLQNSVGDALRKVRARSRPQVLAENLSARLHWKVRPDDVGRVDSTRGR
jgi:hypothetical protein